MNVNCLSTDAPFSVFETFGFQSGRNTDKFASMTPLHSDNGLAFLPRYINSFMSLKVEQYIDFDTHGLFVCSITEARVISSVETMTYTYYQNNVKPKPETEGKKDLSARFADSSMKAMSCRMIISARCANTALLILNPSAKKVPVSV